MQNAVNGVNGREICGQKVRCELSTGARRTFAYDGPLPQLPPDMQDKLEQWVSAKKARDFATSDRIRQEMKDQGFNPEEICPPPGRGGGGGYGGYGGYGGGYGGVYGGYGGNGGRDGMSGRGDSREFRRDRSRDRSRSRSDSRNRSRRRGDSRDRSCSRSDSRDRHHKKQKSRRRDNSDDSEDETDRKKKKERRKASPRRRPRRPLRALCAGPSFPVISLTPSALGYVARLYVVPFVSKL